MVLQGDHGCRILFAVANLAELGGWKMYDSSVAA